MESLEQLQRWFLEAMTAPAIATDVENEVLPSRQQSASDRLAVYQNAYRARLLEVLQNLFPCTRFAVGDELFAQFATGYIHAHPPISYTLANLADKFADYLDATRPADWGEFIVELVRLEQAIDRVFDAPGPEELQPFSMPAEADGSLKLHVVPGLELQRFRYPVSGYFTDWKSDRKPVWPEAREQFVALFRREYIVRRYELTARQYELLAAIQAGAPLREATTAAVAEKVDGDIDSLTSEIFQWFRFWSREQFFCGPAKANLQQKLTH